MARLAIDAGNRNRAEQIRDVVATLNDNEAKLLTNRIEKMEVAPAE